MLCGNHIYIVRCMKMTKSEQDGKSPVRAKRSRAPMICFLVLMCLNALFRFTVDFWSFIPPSEGAFCERFLMCGMTETVPLSSFLLSTDLRGFILLALLSAAIVAPFLLCVHIPKYAPMIWFLVLTCLNALFWFTADFGSFHPASEGAFRERFLLFGITETGPLSFFLVSMGLGYYIFAVVISAVTVALVLLYVPIPKSKALAIVIAILTCIVICVWFVLGFCVTGLRIT
jgi:hypothetical protein